MSTSIGFYVAAAATGYFMSTFVSYKYNQIVKAQNELKEITD